MANSIQCFQTGLLKVNTYIVPLAENKVFIVDPAGAKEFMDAHIVLDYLKSNKLEPVAVFLTHSHFDHITGLRDLVKAYPDLPVAIHEYEFSELADCPGPLNKDVLELFGIDNLASLMQQQPKPAVKLINGSTLDILEAEQSRAVKDALKEWKVILTPGHTPGSCCFYNEKKSLLISGDTLFYGTYGRTDMAGGDETQIQRSLVLLSKNIPKGTKVFPGHDYFGFEY